MASTVPTGPASPCIGVCQLEARHGTCIGCGRTGEEIAAWPFLDAEGRRRLLDALAERRADPAPRSDPDA